MNSVPCVMLFGLLSVCIVRAVYKSQGQAYCEALCDPNANANHCRHGCICAPRVDKPKLGTCVSLIAPIPERLRDPRQSQAPTPTPGSLAQRPYSSQSLGPWKPAPPPRPNSLGAHPLTTSGGSLGARPQHPLRGMPTTNESPSRLQSPGPHPLPQTLSTVSARPPQGAKAQWQIHQLPIQAGSRPYSPVRGSRETGQHPITPSSPARRPLPALPVPQTALETNSRPESPAAFTLPEYTEENSYVEIIQGSRLVARGLAGLAAGPRRPKQSMN
uniref:Putative proline-rich receptor-like protein kinase perk14 n=1 Tax=Amblyomma triste TaxID=251400 RepID=A0A023G248_AMBTT